jgi:hypothetical protein
MKHISDPKAANVNIPAQTPSGGMYFLGEIELTSGVYTTIPFNGIPGDFVDGIEDLVNYRILIANTGYYLANLHASFLIYEDNRELRLAIRKVNGLQRNAITMNQPQHNNIPNAMYFSSSVSRIFHAIAGTYIDAAVLSYSVAIKTKLKGLGVDTVMLTVQRVR